MVQKKKESLNNKLEKKSIIEGIENPNQKFCIGVQWHPEAMEAAEQTAIFEQFIQAAQKR